MPPLANTKRSIKYINRDFSEFRTALYQFAKQYYPNQLVDQNESNPAAIMVEMASYVGDVLSFTADASLAESFLYTANERINMMRLAQSLGYKAKTVVPAQVDLEIFQLLPAIGAGNNTRPNWNYGLYVKAGTVVSTTDTDATFFYLTSDCDFRFSSSFDPTTTTVYSVTQTGEIEYYLAKKTVKAVSGELKTATFTFGEPKIYDKVVIREPNVTDILSVIDSDNTTWHQVDYLAKDLVPITIRNLPYNDPQLAQYRSSVPYLLCFKQTENRFVTRYRKDDFLEIQFGSGLSGEADEEIVPNPFNVGLGLPYFERTVDVSIDPMNFLYTKTYGTAPANTTLTVRYAIANGVADNVSANTITRIVTADIVDPVDSTDSTVLQTIRDSLTVNNPFPAFGGQNKKPLDQIREEAMANFAAQNRAVTREDYILRCYSMPAKYGSIAKCYVEKDTQLGGWNADRVPNNNAINLYVLSYDANRNFTACNEAIKRNLTNYLAQYRELTTAVNIRDPFVIDIGAEIDILPRPDANSNEVILKCLEVLIEFFDPERMQINQPIIISDIRTALDKVEGVTSILEIKLSNIIGTGYSNNWYDIDNATRNGIIYPPMTPSIFQVRYPKRDLKVRTVEG